MAERVSIIMGIFNCASTLSEAIESILSQTFTQWQLIMCDDGSTDATYSVATAYREKYPNKIILIQNEKNMGLNYTLNHCLQYADTEYVARMDGDDISLPDRLEKEVDFLDEHPEYAIVSCPMIYFDSAGDFMTGTGCGEPNIKSMARGTPFCHAPSMVRQEAYKAVNGYSVSPQRLRVEDWDLWIRMYEKGFRGYNISEPLYKMRDDREAYHRRAMKYRLNEARVTLSAIKKLKLSKKNYIFVLRPLVLGLLPGRFYTFLHKNRSKFRR